MALDVIVSRLGDRLAGLSGLKGAYGPYSGTSARVMPRSVDDWPIAIVWPDGGALQPGNGPEPYLHSIEARIWVNASQADFAFRSAYSFVEPARVLFRTDLTLGGACTRCVLVGHSSLELDEAHGKPFFVLPLLFEALEHTATTGYSAT